MIQRHVLALLATTSSLALAAAPNPADFPAKPPVKFITPADALKMFQVPQGYHLELALGEPDISEPVQIAFDGNGRMLVAEMRSYMQDIDGTAEIEPTSRVSMHWSSKNDGVFDKHSVFADKLLLPRLLLPLADGVLIGETNTNDIYLYRDTNGDGVSDEKKLVYEGGPRGGNLEHQPSGLTWTMDNWLYTAVNNYRLRWQDGKLIKGDSNGNGGQWGLCQDDYGKPWVVNAGGERGPLNFQFHYHYGQYSAPGEFEEGYAVTWPLIGLRDFQGGPGKARDEDNTLNHFTATCGEEIYRGDQLPSDLRGDLLFCEPVGRMIRRTKIEVTDGATILHNVTPKSEWLRSSDPCFRPVNLSNGPDGCLYIVDMYRGIIQEGNWTRDGSYLREVIKQYAMDKIIRGGRIWRLVHDQTKPVAAPQLISATSSELVATLAHPNGWWRDTAQKLLILRADKAVTPALEKMAASDASPLARLHALWTLEGLGTLTPAHLRTAMKDKDAHLRHAAIRASETLLRAGDTSLITDIKALAHDPDATVVTQTMLTAKSLNWKDLRDFVTLSILTNTNKAIKKVGTLLLTNNGEFPREFSGADKALLTKGQAIYEELCYTCHGIDGRGMPLVGMVPPTNLAPSLANSPVVLGHRDSLIRALLHGVTGPVGGKTYQALMVPMSSNNDEWISAITSYVRNRFGNSMSLVSSKDVARLRAETKARLLPWSEPELFAAAPPKLANRSEWKLTASQSAGDLNKLVDGNDKTRWSTNTDQENKMWLVVELPTETQVSGVRLENLKSSGDFPRGFRIETSTDGVKWSKPLHDNRNNVGAITEVVLGEAVKTKWLRLSQTGSAKGKFWSIHELDVYGQ